MNQLNPHPVTYPLFASVLIDEIRAANEEAGPKAQAADTMARYSDAGKCARMISLKAIGVEATDPFDTPSSWVTWLGTLIHEKYQDALQRKFPGARIEVKSQIGDMTSGHCDGDIDGPVITAVVEEWNGGRVLLELKTKGSFPFDSAVGVDRARFKRKDVAGPKLSDVIQGALNAKACEADTLVIMYMGLEAHSRNLTASLGLGELDRFMAEWHYSKEEWMPLADEELSRLLHGVNDPLCEGFLGARQAVSDDGDIANLDPEASKGAGLRDWQCGYCSHLQLCRALGPGEVAITAIPVELRTKTPPGI